MNVQNKMQSTPTTNQKSSTKVPAQKDVKTDLNVLFISSMKIVKN